MSIRERLEELTEVVESNLMDGDAASVENNLYELIELANEQQKIITKFQSLVDVDAGEAIEALIDMQDV